MPDHPVIRSMERTGWPEGREPDQPVCPICGRECETIYRNRDGVIFACDGCVESCEAWDVPAPLEE